VSGRRPRCDAQRQPCLSGSARPRWPVTQRQVEFVAVGRRSASTGNRSTSRLMNQLYAAALAFVLAWSPALAQQPEPRMYAGTDFPGNDLVDVPSGSPEECASRCLADGRCKAFTFSIPNRKCSLKWAASRFDGSLTAVSGVVESRPIIPPGSGNGAPGYYPVAPSQPTVVHIGPPSSCSAMGDDVCSGCSVSCPAGQQAACTEGEVHRTSGFSPVCWTRAKCECR